MRKLVPADFKAVRQAVVEVESRTRGEVVPLVVASVSDYSWVRERLALVGLFSAMISGELWSLARTWPLDVVELTSLVIGGAILGALLGSIPAVVRCLLGKKRLAQEVHRRALAEFTEHGCGNTREQTGILVMVALFEHRIEIIADRGIQKIAIEKEGADVWDRVTAEFSEHAKKGEAVGGLILVIQRLGAVLAKHFPQDGVDHNELSDQLKEEK